MRAIALLVLAACTSCLGAQDPLRYDAIIAGVSSGLEVILTLPTDLDGQVELSMPAWLPGDPTVREPWKNVRDIRAESATGSPIAVESRGDGTWRTSGTGAIRVRWRIADLPSSPHFREFIGRTTALVSGRNAFLALKGFEERPCQVTWSLPPRWKAVAALPAGPASLSFVAPSSIVLADTPMLLGLLHDSRFQAAGIACQIAVAMNVALEGAPPRKLDELAEGLSKIVATCAAAFPMPKTEHYLFAYIEGASGRAPYRASTTIGVPQNGLDGSLLLPYLQASVGLFHLVCPEKLVPDFAVAPDWSKLPRSKVSWVPLGLAEHLGRVTLVRAGLASEEEFLLDLGQRILDLRNNLLTGKLSTESAAEELWSGEDPERRAAYLQLRGHLAAVALDVLIRSGPSEGQSLDRMLSAIPERFPPEKGFNRDDWRALATEAAGQDLGGFFNGCIEGAASPDWDEILKRAGLRFHWIQWLVKDPGLRSRIEGDHLVVAGLAPTSGLYIAGLRDGDLILTVNHQRARTPHEVEAQIARLRPEQRLLIEVRRGDALRSFRMLMEDDVALDIPARLEGFAVVLEVQPHGPVRDAGLQAGDVIEKVDTRRITQVADVADALRRVKNRRTLIQFSRGGKRSKIWVEAPPRHVWRGRLEVDPKATLEARAVLQAMLKGTGS